ncbi:MAG: hypothetical protein KatS3mg115_1528 [Candidatus Poribacteria bacterium]|nr:MAG: hypothetical protein KatS3mg115_1528 [Candidatus Poribacteria bacterium]
MGADWKDRGFTLLEIVVVLAIIAIVLTLAAPSLRAFSENQKLQAAANSIQTLVLYAREMAATQREATVLVFDFTEGRYWLAKYDALEWGDLAQTVGLGAFGPSAFEDSPTGEEPTISVQETRFGKPRTLPRGVALLRIDVDREGTILSTTSGYEYIAFDTNGLAEPASLYLANVEGRVAVVDVPREAARARVRRLSAEQVAQLGLEVVTAQ